jgi:hypothetical protein
MNSVAIEFCHSGTHQPIRCPNHGDQKPHSLWLWRSPGTDTPVAFVDLVLKPQAWVLTHYVHFNSAARRQFRRLPTDITTKEQVDDELITVIVVVVDITAS